MTREEAIKIFKGFKFLPREMKAVDMAIQALEQDPCEDAISRQAVLEKAIDYGSNTYLIPVNSVKALPPVNPQPKTGHWKAFTHSAYHGIDDDGEPIWREVKVYHCNLCNRRTVIKENYCPNCGAKMAESEGKE